MAFPGDGEDPWGIIARYLDALTSARMRGAVDSELADTDGSRAFFCGVARKR